MVEKARKKFLMQITADIRIFFFSLNSEKLTFSIRGEDIEEHEANREKVIQELTDRGSN